MSDTVRSIYLEVFRVRSEELRRTQVDSVPVSKRETNLHSTVCDSLSTKARKQHENVLMHRFHLVLIKEGGHIGSLTFQPDIPT